MNVYLVTTDEPFYLPGMIRDILVGPARGHVRGIGLLEPQGKRGWKKLIGQFFDLYDLPTFVSVGASFAIRRLAQKLPSALVPSRLHSVAEVASSHRVPVYRIDDINGERWLEFFRQEQVDLIVSLSASQIFKERILALPSHGVVNVHAAPLPRYRGLMPSFWQLFHGEKEGAVTVHWMERELDSGDIILQRWFPISASDSQDALIRRGKRIGAELVSEAIQLLAARGRGAPTTRNDPSQATYFSFPTREEARQFRAMGKRFL
jgi:methionyl-tRNA formyltransferase